MDMQHALETECSFSCSDVLRSVKVSDNVEAIAVAQRLHLDGIDAVVVFRTTEVRVRAVFNCAWHLVNDDVVSIAVGRRHTRVCVGSILSHFTGVHLLCTVSTSVKVFIRCFLHVPTLNSPSMCA